MTTSEHNRCNTWLCFMNTQRDVNRTNWIFLVPLTEYKDLRLVNGKHRCEGRVEVFYNGTWGTVCSDNLGPNDADVICKQLQCGPLRSIEYDPRLFGAGSGPIWLDEIDCNSHESTLWQCQSEWWGEHNCHHREDAGVVCSGNTTSLSMCGCHSKRSCPIHSACLSSQQKPECRRDPTIQGSAFENLVLNMKIHKVLPTLLDRLADLYFWLVLNK